MYNQKKATSLLTDLTRNTGSAVTMTPKIMWNTTMILLNVSLTFPSAMGSAPKIRNHQKNALKFKKCFILFLLDKQRLNFTKIELENLFAKTSFSVLLLLPVFMCDYYRIIRKHLVHWSTNVIFVTTNQIFILFLVNIYLW